MASYGHAEGLGLRDESRRTRIETLTASSLTPRHVAVSEMNPEEQGLKHVQSVPGRVEDGGLRDESRRTRIETSLALLEGPPVHPVSEMNPEEQGLKRGDNLLDAARLR